MIQILDEQLKQLQMIELQLLKEVHRICEKCDIKYNIIAGTMLGAIRHKGFIPWDDDAEVAMLRDEYEKFRTACKTELDSEIYYFQDYRNTDGYRWGYGKLRRKDTLFLREFQEHMPYEQGVFIDIFVMDYVPKGKVLSFVHNLKCYMVRKMLWSEVGRFAHKNIFGRCVHNLFSKIPEKMAKSCLRNLEIQSHRNKSPYVRMLMFPNPRDVQGYNIDWYLNRKKYKFESCEFYGASDYDGYLGYCYDDYMKLPPKNKRKVHPVTKLKLLDNENKI